MRNCNNEGNGMRNCNNEGMDRRVDVERNKGEQGINRNANCETFNAFWSGQRGEEEGGGQRGGAAMRT